LDTREACQAFVRRYHLSFPNGYDGDGRIARLYGFTYQPYWAVIGRDGQLLKTGYGPRSEDELVSTIKELASR
jgi:peroxiredoxin